MQCLSSSIHIETKSLFSQEFGTYFVPQYHIKPLSLPEQTQALRLISQYMQPMSKNQIAELYARLVMICPEKEKTTIDVQVRGKFYVEELSKYPADIVYQVMREKYPWFPALAKLEDRCDELLFDRKRLSLAIERAEIKKTDTILKEDTSKSSEP